jgi:hypothetical protein
MRLAAACAAGIGAPVAAGATPVVEPDPPGDLFGNSFALRTTLPAGTDEVEGGVWLINDGEFADGRDYFVFDDLVPGSPYVLTYDSLLADTPSEPRVMDELGNLLFPLLNVHTTPFDYAGTVPASGTLVFGIHLGQDYIYYRVTLDAARVPEPSTAVLTGAALVGAATFLRRRRVAD